MSRCGTPSSATGMRWNSHRVSMTGTSNVRPLYVTSSGAARGTRSPRAAARVPPRTRAGRTAACGTSRRRSSRSRRGTARCPRRRSARSSRGRRRAATDHAATPVLAASHGVGARIDDAVEREWPPIRRACGPSGSPRPPRGRAGTRAGTRRRSTTTAPWGVVEPRRALELGQLSPRLERQAVVTHRLVGELAPAAARPGPGVPPLRTMSRRRDRSMGLEQAVEQRRGNGLGAGARPRRQDRRTTDSRSRTDTSESASRVSASSVAVQPEQGLAEADAARVVVVDEDARLERRAVQPGPAAAPGQPVAAAPSPASTDRPMSCRSHISSSWATLRIA